MKVIISHSTKTRSNFKIMLVKNSFLKRCLFIFADNAWIDPAVAAAAAVAHHPGLSADPYHPDYGIGR